MQAVTRCRLVTTLRLGTRVRARGTFQARSAPSKRWRAPSRSASPMMTATRRRAHSLPTSAASVVPQRQVLNQRNLLQLLLLPPPPLMLEAKRSLHRQDLLMLVVTRWRLATPWKLATKARARGTFPGRSAPLRRWRAPSLSALPMMTGTRRMVLCLPTSAASVVPQRQLLPPAQLRRLFRLLKRLLHRTRLTLPLSLRPGQSMQAVTRCRLAIPWKLATRARARGTLRAR